MYSRRSFLIGIGLFLFTQVGLLNRTHANIHHKRSGKFIRQGWVLQDGDI